MRVGTQNVWVNLPDEKAAESVAAVLERRPHIVGLQEWGRSRRTLLKAFGKVVLFPSIRYRVGPPHKAAGYVFAYPLGGQPVGVDAAWGEVISVRRHRLSKKRPGVRATYGTELIVRTRDTRHPETVVVLNVHPVAHHDRPANKAAWREAVGSIEDWADSWHGFRRFVVGDVNKQGLKLHGLKSCWEGRKRRPTFRHRTIDEVYATERAIDVEVIDTPSDHHALIAYYEETP